MSKFMVTINRTETYTMDVEVEAETLEQAEEIIRRKEEGGEYAEELTRTPDDVETHFTARWKNEDERTFTLPELAEKVDIDAWTEAISAMCDMDEIRKEVYEMAGAVEDEENPICPAEFEAEYTELAEKYGFRFNRKGRIVRFDLTNK